jgi:hypothetical protein
MTLAGKMVSAMVWAEGVGVSDRAGVWALSVKWAQD